MTSSELTKLFVPQPFASGTGASLIPIQLSSGQMPNFEDGFPANFSAPKASGGSFIQRGMLNAIGHLASYAMFYRQAGGIFTFDAEFARLRGGYAKGAVLEMIEGNNYYKVISLVDNNMVDFTGNTPTTAQATAGVVAGTVDGVNWAFCEQGVVGDWNLITKVENFNAVDLDKFFDQYMAAREVFPIATFIAPRNGVIEITGGCTVEPIISGTVKQEEEEGGDDSGGTEVTGGTDIQADFAFGIGFHIFCVEGTDPLDDYKNEDTCKMIYERGNPTAESGLPQETSVMSVEKGKRYTIYVVNCGVNLKDSTLEIRVK